MLLTLLHGQLESRANAFCDNGFLFQHRLLLSLWRKNKPQCHNAGSPDHNPTIGLLKMRLQPSKHDPSNSEAFWLQPARIRLDHICWIQLPAFNSVPFFQRHGSYRAKPAQMQSGRPGQVLAKGILSRSKPLCTNHWAQFWQNAPCLLSDSHFQTRLCSSTDDPDHMVQNQPGSDLVLANSVRFGPNGSGLETNRPVLLSQPGSDVNWIWHVYWVICTSPSEQRWLGIK